MKRARAARGAGRRTSVRRRILLLSLLSSFLVILVVVGAMAGIKTVGFSAELRSKTAKIAARLADSLSLPLWGYDTRSCDQIIRSELSDGDLSAIYLQENSGSQISAFGRQGAHGGVIAIGEEKEGMAAYASRARASISMPVRYRDLTIGRVTVLATGTESLQGLGAGIASQALVSLLEGAVIALLAFFAADRLISKRVLRLEMEIGRFSEREPGARSGDEGPDEIGRLARAFNAMADSVQGHAEGLGKAVEERTRELAAANRDLTESNAKLSDTIAELRRAQDEIVESRRQAALGRLVAGIAHQLNTPLAAISSANRFLLEELQGRILRISKNLAGIDEVDAAILEEMLSESIASEDSVDFALLRSRKREFSALFVASGLPDPEGLADTVVDANVHGLGSRLIEFLHNKRARDILSVVEAVNDIRSAGLVINTASEKASNVVRALKVYLGQGQGGAKSRVEIAACMEKVLGLFQASTRSGITLTTSFDRGLRVLGLREQLDLVWMNLIDNAIQAMSGKGRLGIVIERSGDRAVVRVLDTGRGLPQEFREHVFDPFFSSTVHIGGIGLGLSTAKRIVEDHGGSIDFESEAGRTVFTVLLPAEAVIEGEAEAASKT
ncbi:MAG TPA: ATP-binding protein [Rectinemataceae bacterium]|nr:ATP-binding protein [Rectinemataceae bacterium]